MHRCISDAATTNTGTADPERALTVQAHEDRVTGIAWHPLASGVHGEDEGASDRPAFMTASSDTSARVWSRGGKLLQTFSGHLDRQAKCAFHPCGGHAATTSFDKTWRLWDIEVGEEILLQEGHRFARFKTRRNLWLTRPARILIN